MDWKQKHSVAEHQFSESRPLLSSDFARIPKNVLPGWNVFTVSRLEINKLAIYQIFLIFVFLLLLLLLF